MEITEYQFDAWCLQHVVSLALKGTSTLQCGKPIESGSKII